MKKNQILKITCICLLASNTIFAQTNTEGVSISSNVVSPDPTAMLDVSSDSKGVLLPRMTTANRNAIVTPAKGLMVFDTDEKAYFYFDGTEWLAFVKGSSHSGAGGIIPIGGIIMWSGTTPPDGWVLCIKQQQPINDPNSPLNGTFPPDLGGQFIAGYDPNKTEYNEIKKSPLGEDKRLIIKENIPLHPHNAKISEPLKLGPTKIQATATTDDAGIHSHNFPTTDHGSGANYSADAGGANTKNSASTSLSGSHSHTISEINITGGKIDATGDVDFTKDTDLYKNVTAFDNRPDFYVLAYIMRIK